VVDLSLAATPAVAALTEWAAGKQPSPPSTSPATTPAASTLLPPAQLLPQPSLIDPAVMMDAEKTVSALQACYTRLNLPDRLNLPGP